MVCSGVAGAGHWLKKGGAVGDAPREGRARLSGGSMKAKELGTKRGVHNEAQTSPKGKILKIEISPPRSVNAESRLIGCPAAHCSMYPGE